MAIAPVGSPLWESDYENDVIKDLLGALEVYLPAILSVVHPFWKGESLDAFRTTRARKTGDRSAELLGLALLSSDQGWTPFELRLGLRSIAEEIEWLECRIGENSAMHPGAPLAWEDKV